MNQFKDNLRFSSLIDPSSNGKKTIFGKQNRIKTNEIDKKREDLKPVIEEKLKIEPSKPNSFKNENNGFNRDNSRRPYSRERDKEYMEMLEKQEKIRINDELKRKEEEKMVALSIASFPELVKTTNKTTIIENTSNFLEKLKTKKRVDTPTKRLVKPGWTELSLDIVTNMTIMDYNITKIEPIYEKTQQDLAYEILHHLAYLHEKRGNEYIESWGQDEWDNMFLFQNYDYQYFEKLDEIYAKNNPNLDEEYEEISYEDGDGDY